MCITSFLPFRFSILLSVGCIFHFPPALSLIFILLFLFLSFTSLETLTFYILIMLAHFIFQVFDKAV